MMSVPEIQHNSIEEGIYKGMSYTGYRKMVKEMAQNGQTTGPDPGEALIHYTNLNDKRMDRLDKTIVIPEEAIGKIKAFDKKVTWLILTESWCGDAAQTLPVIHKVAGLNGIRYLGFRPSTAAKRANGFKKDYGKLTPEFKEELQIWYNKDKGKTTLEDLLGLL